MVATTLPLLCVSLSIPQSFPPLLYLYIASLRPLLEEGFEAKAFATATIQNQMVGDTLQKLANGIATLDKELYSQVYRYIIHLPM